MSTYRTASGIRGLRLALAIAAIGALAPRAHAEPVAATTATAAAAETGAARSSRAAVRPKSTPPQSESRAGRTEMAPQMSLAEGKSTLVRLPFAASRMSVGDPRIADVILLNPTEVYLLGRSVGTTNLILWNKSNDATIIDLAVGIDSSSLQARMAELLPNEKIHVTVAGDTLILSGMVSDVVKADQALSLANAYVQRSTRSGGATSGAAPAAGAAAPAPAPDAGMPRVINLLSIAAPQQVMLEVKVAEVSKVLVDQLGASLGINKTIGSWSYSLLSSLLSNNPSGLSGASKNNFFNLDAQKRDGLIKVLAEPNIMAISGQEASFLAGGKIFIPVSQTNNGGVPTITLEEKEFGVAVKFTPTVLEGGRINLKVAPEVSDLNKDGIGITATGISATAVLPSFTTRRATTTVQLFDGQSFAIGGLIKNNVTSNIKALPGLGEVPVLGALFRSTDFQTDRSELVFIITPHLVKPLPADYKLPTDGYIQPTRGDMFMQGKMEGSAPAPAPAAPAAPMQPQAAAPQPAAGFDLK
ncbi:MULTISPECIES: type II and III secretion system protein family protein [unclassified Janthinobacterium]|uniref:type II and III secretion system protein family protein n=1 Tax=unclassified Janthinobacterium TaxID=2610881 RepID=UPI000C168B15|nr:MULTISPECIES: type II and III secretion system protein family protein [unclassified Janthinobacterium]MDN2677350.1 type II and III secretion system protein family protein [Janthinobacterium sp. SUN033]MDN2715790.1 type II and III secretion system protein family protein [Janthinobacterium sp. SUN120]MED5614108.1 type II and III secretion system protein family protein [Janthinobacterium sp. P210005]PIF11951.1 pilus assembly protein CpaC [Janthinobacterium sp. 13]